jgi:hypothetical protein
MNRRGTIPALVLAALALLAPCGRAAEEAKPAVTVPERVIIPVGGTTEVTVEIDRDVIEGRATVELRGLPEGVKVIKGEGVIAAKADSKSTSFTLRASRDVKGEQDHEVSVVVTAGDTVGKAAFTLHTENFTLTPASWVIMLVSVGSVVVLVTFCLIRVLTLPPTEEESLKGPLEIDTGNTHDAD